MRGYGGGNQDFNFEIESVERLVVTTALILTFSRAGEEKLAIRLT